jgi:uncharacterized iron-regulated membrane protein
LSAFKFFFTTHKWVGIGAAIIILNTSVTGFMLLIKKNVAWIQPPENKGVEPGALSATFDQVLATLRSVPQADVASWEDVDRLDVRPSKGMLKVRCNNGWEVQIDTGTGEALQTAVRRSDLIESIHDGSFYGAALHDWIMPVYAIALIYLAGSGLFMWIEPGIRRRRRRRGSDLTTQNRS